jgi:nucleoside 2-deoxyribosyltransferase
MRVYLVGPITGQSTEQIANWRSALHKMCPQFEFIDPSSTNADRDNAYELQETSSEALRRLHHGRFIVDRNRALIRRSDVVLANFSTTPDRASIGSIGELFWANSFGKPIIIVRQKHKNIHDHAMLNAIASRVCYSLEESLDVLCALAMSSVNIA